MVLCMRILSDDKGWCGLRCAAHCLQLCINAAISSVRTVERMIGAAKKLVGHFKHSVVATEALKNRQSQMGIDKKKLQHRPHISSQKNAWTMQLKPVSYEIPHASMAWVVKIKMAAIVLTSNSFLIACIT